MTITREDCAAADERDPLAHARRRFELPERIIYLDGNSLGALPKGVSDRLAEAVREEWGMGLIRSWNGAGWFEAPGRIGAKLAPLLGAAPHQITVCDTISINLFKALIAAARLRPGRKAILAERGNFPSDNYIVESAARLLGLHVRYAEANAMPVAIDEDTAVVTLSHVSFRSAEVQDMAAVTDAAHAKGALTVWDLSHSSGAVSLALDRDRVDFAVGCGYKFLNGGPGAPGHLYVAERHHGHIDQPLPGWFAHRAPFDFAQKFCSADGIKAMLCSTPPMLSMLAFETALDAFEGTDMASVQRKSRALGDLLIRLYDQRLQKLGFGLQSPRDSARRGSHVSLTHPEGYRIMQALIARGVIGDFRAPDILRFGFAPLYVRHVDIFDAAKAIEDIVETDAWRQYAAADPAAVT